MARQDIGLVPTVCGLPGSIAKPADGPAAPFWGGKAQTKNWPCNSYSPRKANDRKMIDRNIIEKR